jgi:hypothetical protein
MPGNSSKLSTKMEKAPSGMNSARYLTNNNIN